jgi:hypothetical protein
MQNRSRPRRGPLVALLGAGLVIGLGVVGARRASGETTPNDGAPKGMLVFVAGGECPAGWVRVFDVEGRIVVGAIYPEDVGIQVGLPLGDREERAHEHAYSGEITLPAKNLVAANGGNQSGAAAGVYPIEGTTSKSTSALPFVQVQGCVKP